MRVPLRVIVSLSFLLAGHASAQNDVLKIFLLFGQSNMEGQAYTYDNDQVVNVWNIPSMEFLLSGTPAATNYLANMPHGFKGSLDASWLDPRDDVWCVHHDSVNGNPKTVQPTRDPGDNFNGVGPLSPGFGVNTNFGSMFGAELAMGIRLGDATDCPVFLFKSDKGGTTLGNDWRPTTAVLARGGVVGQHFTNSMGQLIALLDTLDADLADDGMLNAYANATSYEVAGVFWLQGWNEMFNDLPYTATQLQAEYKDNLKDLIYSIRTFDPRIPGNLGIIITESADQNAILNASRMAAVDDLNGEIPGSAAFVDSANTKNVDWGDNNSGKPFSMGFGSHFHARAENYLEIGWKAAGAALSNGFLDGEASLYFGLPEVTSNAFNQAEVSAEISGNADQVVVVWDTEDRGTDDVADWTNISDLGAWNGGAGDVSATLTGLSEDTLYVFRFYAVNTAPTETWTPLGAFTTPFENPPPLLGEPTNEPPTTNSVEVSCELTRAVATEAHVVWAFEDQGETDVATWEGAQGGGSFSFEPGEPPTTLMQTLTNLESQTNYVIRFVASNEFGTVWSAALSILTAREVDDWALTAYYDFEPDGDPYNDPAGEFADDLVGQFNATLSNDVSPNAKDSTQSAIFDGNRALFTDGHTTDLGPDPNAFTIMFWVKGADIDQENNNTRLMTTRVFPTGGAAMNTWQVEGFGNNGANGDKMDVRMHGLGASTNWFSPDAVNALARLDQGETDPVWRHVTFILANNGHPTDSGAFGRTFVDGVQVGGIYNPDPSWDGLNIANQTGQLVIGGNAENAGTRAFTGLLDDVALFAGIVPDDDIAAIASGTASPLDYLVDPIPFRITDIRLLSSNRIEITWNSEPGKVYTVFWSTDGREFSGVSGDDWEATSESTTARITEESAPIGTARMLFFKVGDNSELEE